jgi:hypothetical protein
MRELVVWVAALAACGDVAPPRPRPVAPPAVPASRAVASPPPPVEAQPEPTGLPAAPLELHRVMEHRQDLDVAPFPGGGVLFSGSFLAVALGDRVVQDPAWLAGVPEFINWDSTSGVMLPPLDAPPTTAVIPQRTEMWVGAGNLHGPGAGLRWNGKGWVAAVGWADPRIAATVQPGDMEAHAYLPRGELLLWRMGDAGAQAYRFQAKGAPAVFAIPEMKNGWLFASVAATSLDHAMFCSGDDNPLFVFEDGAWKVLALPDGFASSPSCAATSDGAFWLVAGRPGKALLRYHEGAWATVEVPSGSPHEVRAAGSRLWVITNESGLPPMTLLSNEPVATELAIPEHGDPQTWANGITGLDVESVDIPSVSRVTAGPATAACTSLVLHLGPKRTPALEAAMAAHAPGVAIEKMKSIVPGKVAIIAGTSNTEVIPSKKTRTVLGARMKSFAEASAILASLSGENLDPAPVLLCAHPET